MVNNDLTNIHSGLAISAGAVLIPVCVLSVGLRLWARRFKGVALGADDYTIMAALVFTIGLAITLLVEVGIGQLGYPTPSAAESVGKPDSNVAFWPGELLQTWSLGFVKLSFVFFYRRIFVRNAAPRFNIVTWIAIVIIVLWTLSFFFTLTFICGTDFDAYWTSTVFEKAHCVDTNALHNAFALSDVLIDLIILVMPVPMIWSLHLGTSRKWGVIGIFGLGAVTIITSTLRLVVFFQATSIQYDPDADFELLCTGGIYWSLIESGLGIVAACLPTQYSLLNKKGVQSIVASVRSAVSLQSIRSGSNRSGSNRSHRSRGYVGSESGPWAPDTQNIVTHVQGAASKESIYAESHQMEEGITVTQKVDVERGIRTP